MRLLCVCESFEFFLWIMGRGSAPGGTYLADEAHVVSRTCVIHQCPANSHQNATFCAVTCTYCHFSPTVIFEGFIVNFSPSSRCIYMATTYGSLAVAMLVWQYKPSLCWYGNAYLSILTHFLYIITRTKTKTSCHVSLAGVNNLTNFAHVLLIALQVEEWRLRETQTSRTPMVESCHNLQIVHSCHRRDANTRLPVANRKLRFSWSLPGVVVVKLGDVSKGTHRDVQ